MGFSLVMFVQRVIQERFDKVAGVYPVLAMVGARQSGKTTFLKEQVRGLDSSYVLFDDPDARGLFEEDVKKFEKQFIEGHAVTVLDEVQTCKGAGRKLKYLADTNKKIWLTASSEVILGKEILSFLVGRVSILTLYPFSLTEFLTAKNQKEVTSPILERIIWEHATYGGYPKAVITPDIETKKIILNDLFETMILKDIAQTFSIDDINALQKFCKYLAINTGSILSFQTVSKELGLYFATAKKYLNAMEKSYLIIPIKPFFSNKTKEITKQPKIYFMDTGLRNAITKTFANDLGGSLFENYVLTELVKAGFEPKYWKTKTKIEVDFVVEKQNQLIPIEVKLKAEPQKIERSLRTFIENYQPKNAFVVTLKGKNGQTKINQTTVHLVNVKGLIEKLQKKE